MFLSIAFAIYLLGSKETLKRQITRVVRAWIPERKAGWLIHAAEILNVNFRSFIAGQTLEAVILGILCFIGMLIFRFPYAAMISTMVGVTQLIPIIGGFIGGGIGALMILTLDPIKALWFVIYLIVLQILENNLIYPKVMGTQVHLSSLIILAAVTLGGGIAGPVGMLLGVPVASTLYVLLKEATEKRELALKGGEPTADPPCTEAAPEKDPEPEKNPEPTCQKKPETTKKKAKKKK
jgi:predicted PurR-regulated permease PerM